MALTDVYPGQQLTAAEFGVTPTSTALSGSADLLGAGKTEGIWRAIAINVDDVHGLSPQTQTGDHVDVYAQAGGTLGLLMQNVLVLAAPNQAAAGTTTSTATSPNYVLRIPTQLAARFAFAQDNSKLWFVLRPQKGAKPAGRTPVSGINFSRAP